MSNQHEIQSLNKSIMDELQIEELEDKFELTVVPLLTQLIDKVDLVDGGLLSDCGAQCNGNCSNQCGSQCVSNRFNFASNVSLPYETLTSVDGAALDAKLAAPALR